MADEGLQELKTYVFCHQNTVTHFIVTSPVMDLFLQTERITGPQVSKRRCKQEGLYVEGVRKAAQ